MMQQSSHPQEGMAPKQGSEDGTAPSEHPAHLSRKKKLCFLLAILLVVLTVPEAVTRILAPEYTHVRFSETVTGGYPIGIRGAGEGPQEAHPGTGAGRQLVVEPKPPGEIRLAMLGDSVMWGYALPLEDTIPAVVEAGLRAGRRDISWRCINLAGMGNAPSLRRGYFLENLKSWPVDAVIYQFHLNDVAYPEKVLSKLQGRGPQRLWDNHCAGLRCKYVRHSAFLAFLEHKARQLARRRHAPIDPATNGLAASCDSAEIRRRWDTQFQAIADLKAACDRRGIGFRVYLFPMAEHLSADPRDNPQYFNRAKFTVDPYKRFEEYLVKYNLAGRHLFDIVKAERQVMLAGKKPYNRLYFILDTNHPNQSGAKLFAEAIVEDILSGKVLRLPPERSQQE